MQGKISISRWTSNTEPRTGITISVTDENSHCRMFEVTMSIENFGNAITGLGYVDCDFKLGAVQYAGMKAEYKHELIPVKKWAKDLTPKEIKQLLASYEVDGWEGRKEDFKNHHNIRDNKVKVSFTRFIPQEQA